MLTHLSHCSALNQQCHSNEKHGAISLFMELCAFPQRLPPIRVPDPICLSVCAWRLRSPCPSVPDHINHAMATSRPRTWFSCSLYSAEDPGPDTVPLQVDDAGRQHSTASHNVALISGFLNPLLFPASSTPSCPSLTSIATVPWEAGGIVQSCTRACLLPHGSQLVMLN